MFSMFRIQDEYCDALELSLLSWGKVRHHLHRLSLQSFVSPALKIWMCRHQLSFWEKLRPAGVRACWSVILLCEELKGLLPALFTKLTAFQSLTLIGKNTLAASHCLHLHVLGFWNHSSVSLAWGCTVRWCLGAGSRMELFWLPGPCASAVKQKFLMSQLSHQLFTVCTCCERLANRSNFSCLIGWSVLFWNCALLICP